MAKSLGQIHTVNHEMKVESDSDLGLVDLSGLLTSQLQHQVRQGNYFKVVGIDMNVTDVGSGDNGGQVSGFLNYYAPTRGRCEAYRAAFAAMKNAMKLQGVTTFANPAYDFRASLSRNTDYIASQQLENIATLDGTNSLSLVSPDVSASIFATHNRNVTPVTTQNVNFGSGFEYGGIVNDFVLNESTFARYTGNPNTASFEKEQIPFQLSYTPGSTDVSFTLEWRPDPALYIAMMCGLIEIEIDEIDIDGGASELTLTIAVHVAGWKSIMGNPDKKRRRSSKKNASGSMTKTTTTTVKKS